MGITWKAMPLLSTLAALVIIVHSAEEDFEPDYRDLRPRRMETVTPSYDQHWRMAEMEPVAIQSTQPDWDVNHQEEPPKRRRPVRKRKRRPVTSSEEDLIPQERHLYNEEYRPYQHEQHTQQTGVIRRRRKQFDSRQPERPNTWIDETVDADRPLVRKRGHKRKRPSVEAPWTELSEFNIRRPNDYTDENNDESYVRPTESAKYGDDGSYNNAGEVYLQSDDTIIKTGFEEINPNKYSNHQTRYDEDNINNPAADNTDIYDKSVDEDKSLSEFSIESPSADIISAQEKVSEKSVKTTNVADRLQNNGSLDPHTLKAILKKSNGRSLSEILQQHNLSLVDLLHGKEEAISILKMEETKQNSPENSKDQVTISSNINNENGHRAEITSREYRRFHNRKVEPKPKESILNSVIIKNVSKQLTNASLEKTNNTDHITEYSTPRSQQSDKINNAEEVPSPASNMRVNGEDAETTTKSSIRRRFPVGIRKRIKMRPMNNTLYKSPLSRDLIALTSRRYQLSRNSSRSREWKDLLPTMVKVNRKEQSEMSYEKEAVNDVVTTTNIPEDSTDQKSYEDSKSFTLPDVEPEPSSTNIQTTSTEPSTETTTTFDITITEIIPTTTSTASTTTLTTTTITPTTTTERPSEKSTSRPAIKASDLRRQAFNNRLKRKRLKQKATTTEPTQDYVMKDIFGMANLVSASEFIAKIQPRTTNSDDEQDFTTLEDFMTTESSTKFQTKSKPTKMPRTKYLTTHAITPVEDAEETAKYEIEEILNDTHSSARLSKILMERNMTINELVEHRERGSSHIHLADIFHNASREPNPPEPFLSKSLIEPISKETYPLRALLEANLHDPTAKATTIDPDSTQSHYLNIPVVMDFGNNVNENGENMGIISLFNNFTKNSIIDSDTTEIKDQPIKTSSPTLEENVSHGASRESRILDKDLITWKEIIAIMHRGHNNSTKEVEERTTKATSSAHAIKQILLDDDLNSDDGLIVLNNSQHLKDSDSHPSSTSEEKIEVYVQDKTERPQFHGVLNKTTNSAKSVTVATASIIGLAMVLFLLTYVAFKWKQQRSIFRDKPTSMRTSRIQSPVFENRKAHKNNSSTRSKSPMISSSNIYTIDTLDTRNGNDSPEYMWDTLRKPFQ